jgi:hypothetical protein
MGMPKATGKLSSGASIGIPANSLQLKRGVRYITFPLSHISNIYEQVLLSWKIRSRYSDVFAYMYFRPTWLWESDFWYIEFLSMYICMDVYLASAWTIERILILLDIVMGRYYTTNGFLPMSYLR